MLILNCPVTDNYDVLNVYGFHSESVVSGISFVSEWFGSWSNFFGTRSATFENEFERSKKALIAEMQKKVKIMYPGANAIVNFRIDYEPLNIQKGVMFMLIGQGTVVSVIPKKMVNNY